MKIPKDFHTNFQSWLLMNILCNTVEAGKYVFLVLVGLVLCQWLYMHNEKEEKDLTLKGE
jgi:antibiotic biosynthesis monooxygenase (ABM) superfamily enzyme